MKDFNLRKAVNFFAYVAVVFCAVAIALGKWIDKLDVLKDIAMIIALIITSISAFFYAKSKRNTLFIIVYIVAIVLIVLTYVLK